MEILLSLGGSPSNPCEGRHRPFWDYSTECLRLFSIDQFNCFNIGTKFALRSSKTKPEFYLKYFTGNSDEIESTGIKLVFI